MKNKHTYNFNSTATNRRISSKYALGIICLLSLVFIKSYADNYSDRNFGEVRKLGGGEGLVPQEETKKPKYILLWSEINYFPYYQLNGNHKYMDTRCSALNCFVTSDKSLFDGDVTKFDAIAFNGPHIEKNFNLPKSRSAHQKYIFHTTESADNYPICSRRFNDFFNWTATYRLDSDVPLPYVQIRNQRGEIVGPKRKMDWPDVYADNKTDYRQNKTKAVAWFVSNCHTRSNRNHTATQLRAELIQYGLTVDTFGACGSLKCSRSLSDLKDFKDPLNSCGHMLEKDYFFYLSFENSFAEDYVTEKLITALNNNVVPIVLGGADYNRFLPPGSYLDATNTPVRKLAETIVDAILSQAKYNEFFKWKSSYTYRDPSATDGVCAMCVALNNETFFTTPSYYKDFRDWWHPGYVARCSSVLLQPHYFLLIFFLFIHFLEEL